MVKTACQGSINSHYRIPFSANGKSAATHEQPGQYSDTYHALASVDTVRNINTNATLPLVTNISVKTGVGSDIVPWSTFKSGYNTGTYPHKLLGCGKLYTDNTGIHFIHKINYNGSTPFGMLAIYAGGSHEDRDKQYAFKYYQDLKAASMSRSSIMTKYGLPPTSISQQALTNFRNACTMPAHSAAVFYNAVIPNACKPLLSLLPGTSTTSTTGGVWAVQTLPERQLLYKMVAPRNI